MEGERRERVRIQERKRGGQKGCCKNNNVAECSQK